jgi:hypothetical protein
VLKACQIQPMLYAINWKKKTDHSKKLFVAFDIGFTHLYVGYRLLCTSILRCLGIAAASRSWRCVGNDCCWVVVIQELRADYLATNLERSIVACENKLLDEL